MKKKPSGSKSEVEFAQEYLARFGYIDSPVFDRFAIPRTLVEPKSVQKGVFDDATIEALRKFQSFNHLKVTGKFDEATRSLMEKPRCGFPDIAEFTNTGRK